MLSRQMLSIRKHFVIILSLLFTFAVSANGQTDPSPQSLPYTQNFNSFTGTVTTYPAGWQGWTVGGSLGTTLATAAPSSDQALVASQTNAATSAFVGDMVGKMGMLSTGSNIKAICLAVNTTGVSNVQVIYTAATQGQINGGRIDEMSLQYRVGTSGTFTTVSGTAYQNNATSTTNGAVTTSSNPTTITVTLPSGCGNQSVVELRWIYRDVSGSGNRPGFSIDDITVQALPVNYYSKSTGNLNATATWGTNTDGSGTAPSNFTSAAQIFKIRNNPSPAIGGTWTVSGASSRIVVDGSDLAIGATTTVTGTIDVNAGRTLTISNSGIPTFGALSATSTVVYSGLTFTSTTLLPNTTSNTVTYGNLVLNNTSVAMPASAVDLTFTGNLTLSGTSPFAGGDSTSSTNGYNLVASGTANQTISGNGNLFYVRNIDINNAAGSKTGTVALASNTPVLASNFLRVNVTGSANRFSDGGNTIKVFNNASMGGDAAGYNLTGTLYMAATTNSGNTFIRGYSSGAASSSVAAAPAFNNIVINNASTLSVSFAPSAGGSTYTINGNLNIASTGSGATVLNPNTFNIGGNITHSSSINTFTAGTSTVNLNGASAQTIGSNAAGGISFNKLTINNGSTVTLANGVTVGATLSLSSGVIVTGSNTLTLSATSTITGGSSSSYVNGNLSRTMPAAGVTSMFYPVGDATYSPARLTFSSSLNSGSVLVKSTAGSHPSIAGSYIDVANAVNKYWTITPTGVAPSTINIDLSYPGSSITGGGSNSAFIIRQYNGSSWSSAPSVSNSTSGTSPLLANVTTTTGAAGSSFSGDYVAGNPLCTGPVAGTAAATPSLLCSAGSVTLSLSGASSGSGISYQWQSSTDSITFNDIAGATSSSYTEAISATTYYKCTVTCVLSGSVSSTVATASVSAVPSGLSAALSASTVCSGTTVTLSGSASGTSSYSWSGPNGYTATGLNPAAFTTGTVSAGIYTLTATNSCGTVTATTATLTVNPLPAVTISGTTIVAAGSSATLTFSGNSGDVVYYSWTGGGSSSVTIGAGGTAAVSVTPSSTTTYTVVNATSAAGCTTVVTGQQATVTVDLGCTVAPTSVSASLSATAICTGGTLTLSGAATNATSYSWSGPNGFASTDINPAAFTINTASAGVYTLTATNACGSTTATTAELAILTVPGTATATPSATSVCAGATLTITASATGASAYSWNSPDGSSSTDNPASFVVTASSAGVYTVTASNSCGTSTVYTSAITINNIPTSLSAGLSSSSICVGGTLTLTGAAANAFSYSWSGPDGFTSTNLNPASFTVGTASAGVYTLTATNACGSSTATTTTLSIIGAPTAVTATALSYTVCAGATLTLNGSATGATSYAWSGPGSYSSTLLNPAAFTVNAASAGVYSLTVTNSCGSATATTAAVTVNALPTAAISGSATIASGASTTLVFTGTANATVYYWNGSATTTTTLSGAGSSTVTVTPATTTTYTLTSVSSVAGCSQAVSGSATITVTPAPFISLTNAAPTYTQNFNSLPNTGTTFTWTDNSTIQGWYAAASGTASYRVDNGSSSTGATYSYGSTGATDRALGSLSSGTPGTIYYGARFKNNGTSNIVGFTVSYTGEQWRNGGPSPAAAQSNTMDYQIGATSISAGTWTNVPGLTFTSPVFSTTAATLDGNATANRTAISSAISTTVTPGQEVWIRMVDINDPSSDHALAMDDLTVTAIYSADYYSAATGNLDNVNTWGTNADGSGAHPANFITAGQVFHVANGNTGTFSGSTWTVSGSGSKIALDAGTDLAIGSSTTVTATIDVAAGRTLTLSNASLPTLGSLNATSTIVYNGLTFTSTTLLPNTTSNAVTYGNLVLNNTSVAMPASAVDLTFTGNLTLSGTSPFAGGDSTSSTNGYNLVASGTANQTISGNGNLFYVRNIDINNAAGSKTGTVALASNTPVLASNFLRVNVTGSANRFSDGGNTIKVFNNASMGGDAAGYNLTGTLYMAATTNSGNTFIRGYSSGAASSSVAAAPAFNNIVINNASTLSVSFAPSAGGSTYTINGNFNIVSTGTGATVLNPNTFNIGGNITHSSSTNTFTAGTSTVNLNGASAQTIGSNAAGGISFNKLTINNGSTVTLVNGVTVGATLSLSSGVIVTGSNMLTLSATSTITGGSSSSYVNGNLSRTMPAAGVTSMFYPVGDATYSPARLTFSSSLNSGSVLVKSTAGSHPSIAGSYIDVANAVNKYWTITPTGVAPSTINIDLSYPGSSITGGGSNSAFIIRQYNGSSWSSAPSVSNSTSGTSPLLANVTTTTGAAGSSFSGDYVAGNPLCTGPVAGTAAATPSLLCSAGSVTLSLSGASSGSGISYQWQSSTDSITFNDIAGATSSSYTEAISATTYYKCTVTCVLSGSVSSTVATASVSAVPSGLSAALSASTVCSGTTVTLSGNVSGTGSYSWSGPGGYTATDLNPAAFTAGTASAGVYTLTVSNSCGTVTATTAALTVNPLPAVTISGTTIVAFGSSATLTFSGNSGDVVYYSWTGGGSSSITIGAGGTAAVSVTPSSTTTYTVTNATSAAGCTTVITDQQATVTVDLGCTVAPTSVSASLSAATICAGGTLTLSGAATNATSYSWSGPDGFTSTDLNPAAITVSTLSSGIYTLTATNPCGSTTATTDIVTVNTAPTSPIAAASATTLCTGTTLTLTGSADGATSYSWNGPGGFTSASNPASVAVTSSNAGIYTLTATSACGSATATTTSVAVTTVPTVAAIAGTLTTSLGSSVSLTDATASGTWSSGNTAIASVSSTGVVIGTGLGAATISYTVSNSCGSTSATAVVTVNAVVASSTAIWDFTGSTSGLASSSTSTAVPVSGCTSGIGNTLGTVSPAITSSSVSSGYTGASGGNNIGNAAATGSLSASSAYVQFTLTPNTGYYLTVSGISFGSRSTSTGPQGYVVKSSIDGYSATLATGTMLNNSTYVLFSPAFTSVTGANNTAVTVRIYGYGGSGTASPGTVNWRLDDIKLTYAANPIPCSGTPAAGTLTGATTFCGSGSTTLSFTPGSTAAGVTYQWASSNVGTSTSFTPVSGATSTSYTTPTLTSTTYYRVGSTCGYSGLSSNTTNVAVTVNPLPAVPGAISGPSTVCVGSAISLTDTTSGGSWSSSAPGVATVDASGVVTALAAGSADITYTVTNSCGSSYVTQAITVNPLPVSGSILSPSTVCIGTSSLLSATVSGGAWSTSDAAIASVDASGLVYGISSGTANISYTVTNTCGTSVATAAVTINTSPSAGVITGASSVCQGAQVTLADGTPGGTWSSSDNTVASINASGIVTGITAGTADISYTVTSACGTAVATYPVTVNPLPATPAAITGASSVCLSANTTLSDVTTGGTWASSTPAVATINGATGVVYGVSAGTTTITYTVTNGCGSAYVTYPVTVNPFPVVGTISGPATVCTGAVISLSDTTAGGTWSSSAIAVATVDGLGTVTGVSGGSATILYAVTNACGTTTVTYPVTVNTPPVLAAITGTTTIVLGTSATLSNSTSGGTWASANTAIASIGATGIVTGTGLGATTISYTATNLCGSRTITITETVLPAGTTGSALWDFTGSTSGLASSSTSTLVPVSGTSSGIGNSLGTVSAPINGSSVSTGYTGASGGNNIGNAVATGSLSTSSAYVQFTLTPNAGYYLNITGISFGARSSTTGPQAYAVKSSVDGYSATLATGTMANNSTYVLFSPSFTSVTGAYNSAVTVRIYGYNGSGSPATGTINWRLDDINIGYTVNPVPCSGTPAAGTVSGATAICGSGAATLTFAPGTTLTGTSYQWTISDNVAGTFAPIAGATSTTYATGALTDTMYYKVATTCAYSGLSANTTAAGVIINPIPVVSATSPACAGTPVTASGAATYSWSPSTGLSATTGATVIPSGTLTTTDYTVTGTSEAGCASSYSLTVNAAPAVTISSTGGGAICDGGSVTLTASGADSYSWSPAVAISASTGSVVVAAPSATTTYSVIGSNVSTGCSSAVAATYTVSVGSPGNISLGAVPEVCQSVGSISVPYLVTSGTPVSYSINWSAAAIAAGYTNVVNAPLSGGSISIDIPATGAPGTYTGIVTPSGGVCAGSTQTITSTVYAVPAATIVSAENPCANHTTAIEINGVPGETVSYMVDSGSVINGTVASDSTLVISTGIITMPHNYTVINASNPVCATHIDTVVSIMPIPMQWIGGAAGHETDWNTAANWSCGFVPTSSDSVTILSSLYPPVMPGSVSATVGDLVVASGTVINLNTDAALNVTGDINNSGTVAGNGRVIMNGSAAQKISGIGTISNLELNNANGATIQPAARAMISNTLYLTAGTLTTNDSLELLSTDTAATARIAEIPAAGASVSGRVKTDQYVQGGYRRFRFWGHSFSETISLSQLTPYIDITGPGGSTNGFTTTASNNPSAFRYDPSIGNDTSSYSSGWIPFTRINALAADSNKLHPGQGIRLFFRGSKGEGLGYLGAYGMYTPSSTINKMIGHVNQGAVSIPLKRGTDIQTYNQISNPYPSPVDIGTVLYNAKAAGQITGSAFYVWNPSIGAGGQYMAIPIGTSAAEPYYIQANTSFQVRADHDGAHVDFVESDKVAAASLNLFRAPAQAVRFNIYDTSYRLWDVLSLQFNDKASDAEDKLLDATKPYGPDMNFYSIATDGRKLAIDARPYEGDKAIPLGVKSAYQQDFVIRAESISVPTGGAVTLHDKLLNKYVDMKEGAEYRFTVGKDKATQGDDRFELVLKPTTAVAVKGLEVSMAPNPASDDVKITFTSGSKDNVSVRIMDVSGVSIYNQDLGTKQNGVITVPMSNFAAGVYMVEITQGEQKVTKRLVKE